MRISDWSSDVCSSDLYTRVARTPWEIPSQLGRAPRDRGRAAFRRRSMSKDLFGYTIPSLLRGLGVLSAYLQSIQQAVDEDRFMDGTLLKARMAADLLPLGTPIHIAFDTATNGLPRLPRPNPPWIPDK